MSLFSNKIIILITCGMIMVSLRVVPTTELYSELFSDEMIYHDLKSFLYLYFDATTILPQKRVFFHS